uniref:ribonuclease H n=1 Tax=Naja naja TaxID=35670 RepID=A0A8C6VS84_NAJNA
MKIGGNNMTFLVDTGASRSVVTKLLAPFSADVINVQGVDGSVNCHPFLKPLRCSLNGRDIEHQFLYVPECPIPLLGQDMLCKMGATLSFEEDKMALVMRYSPDEMWRVMVAQEVQVLDTWQEFDVHQLWAEDNLPGYAVHHAPLVIQVKPLAVPVCLWQRSSPRPIAQAIQDQITKFLKAGILTTIQSPWNTPILPIPKPNGSIRPVQDLRIVNNSTITVHAAVSNLYTLLSLVPASAVWFSVVDLKDAFFTIPIHESCQELFAFEWGDPTTGQRKKYSWTRLPQGFKNSPTLFGNALASDLEDFQPCEEGDVLLQNVDDVLITGQTKETCWENTNQLLHLLMDKGYRASRKKAQLVKPQVKYLGYTISQGQRAIGRERKEAVCRTAEPTNRRELQGF